MKKIFLLLFLFSFCLTGQTRFNSFTSKWQKETIDHYQRMTTEGVVVNDMGGLNELVTQAKADNTLTMCQFIVDPNFGCKVDGSGYVSKLYNVMYKLGNNLTVNGTFDADASWNKGTAVSIANGVLKFNNALTSAYAYQGGFTSGKKYQVTYTVLNYVSGSVSARLGAYGTTRNSNGTYTEEITATDVNFNIVARSDNSTFNVDNVVIQEVLNPDLEQSTAANQPKLIQYAPNSAFSQNLLTGDNSTFTSGVGDWKSYGNGVAEFTSGFAKLTLANATYTGMQSGYRMLANKRYFASAKVRLQSGTATELKLGTASGSIKFTPTTTSTVYSGYFDNPTANLFYLFATNGNGSVYEVDDVSIQEVTIDTNRYSLLFDGSNDFLKSPLMTLNQPTTVYLGVRQISFTDGRFLLDGYDTSNRLVIQQSSNRIRLYAGAYSTGNSDLATGCYGLLKTVFNGASSSIQVNNLTKVTTDAGLYNAGGVTLGAYVNGTLPSNIEVGTIIILDAVPNATQDARIKNYLMSRWKL